MVARSAGLLLFRISDGDVVEVLLAHPGGPFWARRDVAAWSVPKGLIDEGEDPLAAAFREFEEETGFAVPDGEAIGLGELQQPGGKRVVVWAMRGDVDETQASSNTFELEWPRGSGTMREFPEVDRVAWVGAEQARAKLVRGQVAFVDRLLAVLGTRSTSEPAEGDESSCPGTGRDVG